MMAGGGNDHHYLNGMPRLSLKSFIAILLMVGSGALLATIRTIHPFMDRHGKTEHIPSAINVIKKVILFGLYLGFILFFAYNTAKTWRRGHAKENIYYFIIGIVFSFGILIS